MDKRIPEKSSRYGRLSNARLLWSGVWNVDRKALMYERLVP
jgi:hypothetical protein